MIDKNDPGMKQALKLTEEAVAAQLESSQPAAGASESEELRMLAWMEVEFAIDTNGDPVGPQPAAGWETGYCAGMRTVYRALKKRLARQDNAAPQATELPRFSEEESPRDSRPAAAAPSSPTDKNYRRLLEESNLPIELAVEIADKIDQLSRELAEAREIANHDLLNASYWKSKAEAAQSASGAQPATSHSVSMWVIEREDAPAFYAGCPQDGILPPGNWNWCSSWGWAGSPLKALVFNSKTVAEAFASSQLKPSPKWIAREHLWYDALMGAVKTQDEMETLLGVLGDLTREAAKHIRKGEDGYAHLHFAQQLLKADDARRSDSTAKKEGQ